MVHSYLEQQLFHQGNLKVKGLIQAFDGEFVAHPNADRLMNTNTPEQWRQSQHQLFG